MAGTLTIYECPLCGRAELKRVRQEIIDELVAHRRPDMKARMQEVRAA